MKKKLISILLALVVCLSMIPAMAFAADPIEFTKWNNLQFDAAQTYVTTIDAFLLNDVNADIGYGDGAIVIPSYRTYTIDLRGKTLNRNMLSKAAADDGYVFRVEGTLIIKDSIGSGKITGGNGANGGGIYVADGGTLKLEGGSIVGNKASANGGGVYVAAGGTFRFEGGSVIGNSANNGGGVYVEAGGTFAMPNNTVIQNNTAAGNGGGVYTIGTATITGGQISGNTAGSNGGGVYVCTPNATAITNVSIFENKAGSKGGGIYAEKSYDLSSSVQLNSNTAGSSLHANLSAPNQIKSSSGSFDGLVNFFLRIFSSIFGR